MKLRHICPPIQLRHTVETLSRLLLPSPPSSLPLGGFEMETGELIARGLFTLSRVCFQERCDYALRIHNDVIARDRALNKTQFNLKQVVFNPN